MCGAIGAVGAIDSIGVFSPDLELGGKTAKHVGVRAWQQANRILPICGLGSASTN